MKSIGKILKKFTLPIIITICFLILQAKLDLSLPDYTANIINIGIQQKGISKAYPLVIGKDTLEQLSNFSPSILSYYELKEPSEYEKKYSYLQDGPLYFVKKLSSLESDELESEMLSLLSLMDNTNSLDKLDESMKKQVVIQYINSLYEEIGIDVNKMQMEYIMQNGLIMILIAFGLMATAIVVGLFASRIATKFAYMLRNVVVSKIMSFSAKEFKEFSVSSLITRSTNDIQQIQMIIIMFLRIIIFAPILGFGALFKVLGNQMNWVLALAIGIILFLIIFLFVFAMPKFKQMQKLIDKLNLVIRERLLGLPVIRAFGAFRKEEEKFDVANKELANTILFCDRAMGILMPTMTFVMNGVAILIIWVGSSLIDVGSVQVGTLMAFITYAIQVIMSFLMISMVFVMLPRALVSVKRIAMVLDKKASILNKENALALENVKGKLEFKNVSFRYPDASEDMLSNISFVAKPGTTTAILGSTGSGKSTLINLIPRFFDVSEGSILIDDKDIRDVDIHDLRDNIGFVPQKGNLFSGTIKSNVLFGLKEEDDKVLKEACDIAQASDFINDLGGYDKEISQSGKNVSGGQRQRLAIARAIAKKAKVYIFDDSFSALDFKTDAKLRSALKENISDATILIVAQRISTVLNADNIVVLDGGKMVGMGTHKELYKNCEVYREICLSQLKESELNG